MLILSNIAFIIGDLISNLTLILNITTATLIAILIGLFLKDGADKYLKFNDLLFYISYKDINYSYLVLINYQAIRLLEEGKTRNEVANQLPLVSFPFLERNYSGDKARQKAVAFVKQVISNKELVETFLCQYGFSRSAYNILCQCRETREMQEAVCIVKKDLILPPTLDIMVAMDNLAKWQSPNTLLANEFIDCQEDKVRFGKNQLILYLALKDDFLKNSVNQNEFALMMKSIGKIYPNMKPVSSPAMSQATLSSLELQIVEKAKEKIRSIML